MATPKKNKTAVAKTQQNQGIQISQGNLNVFVSWSGEHAKSIANHLSDWIPKILKSVNSFASDKDTEAGVNWFDTITGQLSISEFGIICVTPENIESRWVHFEAGALAVRYGQAKVVPYLTGVKLSALSPPLGMFQGKEATEQGTLDLLRSINTSSPECMSEADLEDVFEVWWPKIDATLTSLKANLPPQPKKRTDREILEEILGHVRSQVSRPTPKPRIELRNRHSNIQGDIISASADQRLEKPMNSIKSKRDEVFNELMAINRALDSAKVIDDKELISSLMKKQEFMSEEFKLISKLISSMES